MEPISTAFGTNGLQSQDLIKRDVDSEIIKLSPYDNPLTVTLTPLEISDEMGGGVKTQGIPIIVTDSYVKEQYVKEYVPVSTQLAAAVSSNTQTTITVTATTGSNFIANDLIRIVDAADTTGKTVEQLLVVSVAGDVITVKRGLGGPSALSTIAVNSYVSRVATAFGEASSAPAAKVQKSVKDTYNVQLFRTSISVSQEAIDQETYAGQVWEDEKKEKAILHNIDFENAILFGEKGDVIDINGNPGYTTQGIIPTLRDKSLIDDITGPLTEDKFNTFLSEGFKHGTKTKILFCSGEIENTIGGFMKEFRRTTAENSKFGFGITEYSCPSGVVKVVRHPMFTAENGLAQAGILLDVEKSLNILQFKTGAVKFTEHPQVNGTMVKTGDYTSRKGLMMKHHRNNRMFVLI